MASKDKNSAQKPAASKKPSTAQEGRDVKAQRELGIVGPHGDMRLASVIIEGYSLEVSPRANSANISWMGCWRKTAWPPKPSKQRRKTTRCSWRTWCSDF